GHAQIVQRVNVARIMIQLFAIQPTLQPIQKKSVTEVDAPERVISHGCLGKRAIQIKHADQTGPLAAPVRHGENWTAVGIQAVQHVMAVLPYSFYNDQRSVVRDLAKNFHAILLVVDETVLFDGIEGVTAADFAASFANRIHDSSFRA